ncbi:BPI fold-containing family B member 3-like [Rhineura floridana]|uniref:BPI fold-containing family B member 3-like n=1 Tax=Rhineura floridana TaxID=261503 RepID=UPI002AC7F8A6|nr:BPI fold-containing family B member 3-like [Rhineura floridana]
MGKTSWGKEHEDELRIRMRKPQIRCTNGPVDSQRYFHRYQIKMLKAWTILLLCGLLPFTQAVAENVLSVAQLDKSVLENVISDSLAKGNVLQGLLGGLLGGGLLGGVLAGQGGGNGDLVGGLTGAALGGQGGPLDGVVGGQGGGLLGGVLGGQGGPLDGVVGGQARGLLGGVLGGQRGFLGNVFGGEGLLGLKIVDIVLPKVSLKLLKGVGIELNLYTKVAVRGNTILSGLLNLLVEVNITANARLVQDRSGAHILVVENCKTNLGGIKILSGILPLNLDNALTTLLNNVIPGVLCPVIDLVLNVVNTLLSTVNSVLPFGMLGKLHYTLAGLPLFNDQHIILNLNLMVTDHEGNATNLAPAQLPSLPPAVDNTSQLLLPGDLLSSLLQLLVTTGGLNADITDQVLQGSVPLTTSSLQSMLPELSRLLPADLPLVVKIRISDVPAVSLQKGNVTVTLAAAIEVLARTGSGLKPLLGMNAHIGLRGAVTITGTKLAISLSLQSVVLNISSSQIGSFDMDLLKNWITNILRIGYLPVINGALDVGIPLPNLFNLNFAEGVANVVDTAFVANVIPKLL